MLELCADVRHHGFSLLLNLSHQIIHILSRFSHCGTMLAGHALHLVVSLLRSKVYLVLAFSQLCVKS